MTRHFQLKVTSPTTNIDVDSIDGLEVARIAQLAGLQVNVNVVPPPPAPDMSGAGIGDPGMEVAPMGDPSMDGPAMDGPAMDGPAMDGPGMGDQPIGEQTCSICGSAEHSELECPHANPNPETGMNEDVAEYDHGHHKHPEMGEEVDPDTYLWQPKRAKQHFGKQADNTMDDPISETAGRLYRSLTEAYLEYLREERENSTGNMSPLSDPDIEDFDKDPMSNEPVVDDGSRSPLSTVRRQPAKK